MILKHISAALSFLTVVGCADTSAPASLALTVNGGTHEITQGQSTTVAITLTRLNISGPVSLNAGGLPSGVTATFTPPTPGGSESSVNMTLSAAILAPPGEFAVTVHASANGVAAQPQTFALRLLVAGDYSLSHAPQSIIRGQAATSTLTIGRTGGFAQTVALSLAGLPAGVTATLDPPQASGATSTVTFSAAEGATLGDATIGVTGTTPGLADRTGSFVLTVLPPPSMALTLASQTATVEQGQSVTVGISVARTNFHSDVTLSASGLPPGVTATFDPAVLSSGGTASTLTLSASNTAPFATPGEAAVTIAASTETIGAQTATLALTVVVAGGYTLSSPATSVVQGQSAMGSVTVSRTGGFAQAVALSLSSLPSGVTATLTPTSVTETSATIAFTASASAQLGDATVTVTGTTPGLANRTTTLTLSVVSPPAIAVTVSSMSPQVGQSGSATATVAVSRTNYAGAIELSASGLPSGVTASFSPATLTGSASSSILTLSASGSATLGSSAPVITATPTGPEPRSVTIALTVTSPTTPVSLNLCTPIAVWAAYQNAGAPWTQITPDAVGTVRFNATEKVIFAFTRPSVVGSSRTTRVLHVTSAQLQGLSEPCFRNTGATPWSYVLEKTNAGWAAWVGLPSATITHGGGGGTSHANSGDNLTDGPSDIVASEGAESGSGVFRDFVPNRVVVKRSVQGGAFGTLDFRTSDAVTPGTHSYTVSGLPGAPSSLTRLRIRTGVDPVGVRTTSAIWQTTSSSAAGTYSALPADKLASGEIQEFEHTSFLDSGDILDSRSVVSVLLGGQALSLSLGPALSTPAFSVIGTAGGVRYRTQVASQPEYGSSLLVTMSQAGGNVILLNVTSDYLNGTPSTWDVAPPDFAVLPGWSSSYGLSVGTQTLLAVEAFNVVSVLPLQLSDYPRRASGTTVRSARGGRKNQVP